MRTQGSRLADGALAVTVVTWASAFPAIRVGLDGYGPWSLGLLRLLVASLCLVPVAVAVRLRPLPRRHWPRVVVAGLLGQTLYQGLLMTGERTVPAGTASLLIATAPVFSVLGAAVLLHERVGRRWWGMAVAFAGAALVAVSLGVGGGTAAVVVLAAALCQGAFHVVVKPLAESAGRRRGHGLDDVDRDGAARCRPRPGCSRRLRPQARARPCPRCTWGSCPRRSASSPGRTRSPGPRSPARRCRCTWSRSSR